MSRPSDNPAELADQIETTCGLAMITRDGPIQLGLRKTSMVIAALRSSADNAVDAMNALSASEEADITSMLEQLNHNPTIDAYRRKVKAFRSQIIQLAAHTQPQASAVSEATTRGALEATLEYLEDAAVKSAYSKRVLAKVKAALDATAKRAQPQASAESEHRDVFDVLGDPLGHVDFPTEPKLAADSVQAAEAAIERQKAANFDPDKLAADLVRAGECEFAQPQKARND